MRKKIFLVVAILFCMLLLQASVFAQSTAIIHEEIEETNLAKDVVYKCITRFTDLGWYKIHVIEGNLTDEFIELEALTSPAGIGTGSTLPQMAINPKIIAAINGDFFISGESYSPIGPVVRNGVMHSSPTYRRDELAVLALDYYNTPLLDYWQWQISLQAKDKTFALSAINKTSSKFDYPVVYTKAWGQLAPQPNIADIVYIVAENNRVSDIIQGPGRQVEIPENGMVIMARGNLAAQMLQVLEIGSDVELDIHSTPDYAALKLALGGGTILVKNGSIYPFTHNVSGNHPRTAIGFSYDGSKVMMVTVEGRIAASRGMSQAELAQLMLELGAYHAINLDGGGSTTMLARKPGAINLTLVNTPSDGSLRRIANGISLTNNAPLGELKHIILEVEDKNLFLGFSRTITVRGFDEHYNPVTINPELISWELTGVAGHISNQVFYPAAAGTAEITAHYLGLSAKSTLKVLEPPVALILPDPIRTNTERTLPFTVYGKNLAGFTALIENRDLNLTTTIGYLDKQNYHSGSREGAGEIKLTFNGLDYIVPVSVGSKRVVLDNFERLTAGFSAYPAAVTGSYELDFTNLYNGVAGGKLTYDFTATEATAAAYVQFDGDGIILGTLPEKIGVYAYSPTVSSHWVRLTVEDATGKSLNLDLAREINWTGYKFIETQVPQGLTAPLYLKRLYVVETNPAAHDVGEIYFDDLTAIYPHELTGTVYPARQVLYDPHRIETPPANYTFSFSVFGSTYRKKLIDKLVVNKMTDLAVAAGQPAIFTGKVDKNVLKDLDIPVITSGEGYTAAKFAENIFLQLDNSSGGLRSYSPQQWHWFKEQLANMESGNLFIIMPRPVWGKKGFTDKLEAELFNSYLSELFTAKKINVYVLTGGEDKITYEVRSGVKYLTVSGTDVNLTATSGLENYNYLRFYVTETGQVHYQVLPLFPLQ